MLFTAQAGRDQYYDHPNRNWTISDSAIPPRGGPQLSRFTILHPRDG